MKQSSRDFANRIYIYTRTRLNVKKENQIFGTSKFRREIFDSEGVKSRTSIEDRRAAKKSSIRVTNAHKTGNQVAPEKSMIMKKIY